MEAVRTIAGGKYLKDKWSTSEDQNKVKDK